MLETNLSIAPDGNGSLRILLMHFGAAFGLAWIVWKFFGELNKTLRPETRKPLSDYLRGLSSRDPHNTWAKDFGLVFDSVFGARHLSLKRLRRSALASSAFTFAFFIAWIILRPIEFFEFLTNADGTTVLPFVAFLVLVNLLPDYLSLLETRWLISLFDPGRSLFTLGVMVLGDALLTMVIAILAFIAVFEVGLLGIVYHFILIVLASIPVLLGVGFLGGAGAFIAAAASGLAVGSLGSKAKATFEKNSKNGKRLIALSFALSGLACVPLSFYWGPELAQSIAHRMSWGTTAQTCLTYYVVIDMALFSTLALGFSLAVGTHLLVYLGGGTGCLVAIATWLLVYRVTAPWGQDVGLAVASWCGLGSYADAWSQNITELAASIGLKGRMGFVWLLWISAFLSALVSIPPVLIYHRLFHKGETFVGEDYKGTGQCCSLLIFCLVCSLGFVPSFGGSVFPVEQWTQGTDLVHFLSGLFKRLLLALSLRAEEPGSVTTGIFLYSTFLTSIWMWVSLLGESLVRFWVLVRRGTNRFLGVVDIEDNPYGSVGLAAAIVAFVSWIVIAFAAG